MATKSHTAATTLVAALTGIALVGAMAGCAVSPMLPGVEQRPSSPHDSGLDPDTDGDFAVSDLMFAAMMIPHHQQAVDMSTMALEVSQSPDVRDLATRIRDGQLPEIVQMQAWLDTSGFDGEALPGNMMGYEDSGEMDGMPRMGGMGGMATAAELEALEAMTSPEFDEEFLTLMVEHHEGALVMVRMIDNSTVSEVRTLAKDIDRVQRVEITEMNDLMGQTFSE